MSFRVVDAAGRVIEVEDDQPVPDGCRLMVSPLWMDSEQRANRAAFEHVGDAHADDDLTDAEAAEQRCADA